MLAKKTQIVRIEEDGTVLVIVDAEDGHQELKSICWDVLCGCEVTFTPFIDPAVIKALEEYETPLPRKSGAEQEGS